MIRITAISSAVATALRKVLEGCPIWAPARVSRPTAKAMSVAMGIPQPDAPGPSQLKDRYRTAGRSIPPIAAARGRAAFLAVDRAPLMNSRFTSRPIRKKK